MGLRTKKLLYRSMRKTLLLALMVIAVAVEAQRQPAIPRDDEIESKVEALLGKMTLDEKIGQMLELNLDIMGSYETGEWELNETILDTCISKYKVGSILNAPGTRAHSVEQWQEWITLIQEKSMKYIGIPCLYGLDNNHGVTYEEGGTLFPHAINIAASFNTDLIRQMAQVAAYESRAANCPFVFNPTIDLGRDPRWPRIWESFGEDPILNGKMVAAEVRGYQGDDPNHIGRYGVATNVKHYMAYGAPWSGKDRTPAYLSPQVLREKYFEPFRQAFLAGSLSIMVNSSSINGEPVHVSHQYLTEWLKEGLNWDGMILTDWADIDNLWKREKVAKDKKDAIRMAINAGIDMSMDPYSVDFCILLKELVEEGKVSQERIDDATRRILRLKYRLGLFDEPNTGGEAYSKYGCEEYAEMALKAAEEAEILLKNDDGILPIRKGTRILLTGPNANAMRCLSGGWSYSWQGTENPEFTEPYNTIYEALCNKFGEENIKLEYGVTYKEAPGAQYFDENEPDYAAAVSAAADVDLILACIGENSYCETPGNLTDLWLSEQQRTLVKELAKTGKPIVLILNEGRPRLIADIEPLAKGVVDILLPSNYGADALANLLAGDVNFSAKLPYTYPREINSLANYDYKVSEEVGTMEGAYNYDAKVSLQWPFGYGLSYTTFEYANLSVDKPTFTADDELTFTVDVRNTGSVRGKESVLLYTSDLVASLVPDNKRLREFVKIELEPGETKTVSLKIKGSDMAFVGLDGEWVLEEGDFVARIGDQAVDLYCSKTEKVEK